MGTQGEQAGGTAGGPSAMEGGGFYNRHSTMQATAASKALDAIAAAAGTVPLGGIGPVRIADYGSSEGRNSMAPVSVAIDAIRRRTGPARAIEVVHTDLPGNDFCSLFTALAEDPASYRRNDPNVFASAVGLSYYEPLFAPGTVHLGWNSATLHWMSRATVAGPDSLIPSESRDPAILAATLRQSADDWRNFLARRSAELVPGGSLVCGMLARQEGDLGWPVMRRLFDVLAASFADGYFRASEASRYALPMAFRSPEDIRAPFSQGNRFHDLSLEQLEMFRIGDAFFDLLQSSGDRRRYARSWSDMARAVYAPLFASILDADRPRDAVLDGFFARFAASLEAEPVENHFWQAVVVIRKA